MSDTKDTKTKRSAGRPKGSRNKVCAERDIKRAINSGFGITDLKDRIEHYIQNAEEEKLSPNQYLAFVKEGISLQKWLVEMNKYYEKRDKASDGASSQEDPPSGQIAQFQLKAAK